MATTADLHDLDKLLQIARTHWMNIGYSEHKHPQVLMLSTDGSTTAQVGMIGVPPEEIDGLLQSLPEIIPLPFTPKWIALTIDAYVNIPALKSGKEILDGKRPEEAFNDGDPGAAECIFIRLSGGDGVVTAYQPYRWTPIDGWEWDDPIIRDEE